MNKKQGGKAGQDRRKPPIAEKIFGMLNKKLAGMDAKRMVTLNIPYFVALYLADKTAWLYRHCPGGSFADRAGVLYMNFNLAFKNPLPSIHAYDLAIGIIFAACIKLLVYEKGKNAKKYRHGEEYGSARWGA